MQGRPGDRYSRLGGVAFTYDRYGHLRPEVDKQAAAELEAVRPATRLA
jgi:hypothetical protein